MWEPSLFRAPKSELDSQGKTLGEGVEGGCRVSYPTLSLGRPSVKWELTTHRKQNKEEAPLDNERAPLSPGKIQWGKLGPHMQVLQRQSREKTGWRPCFLSASGSLLSTPPSTLILLPITEYCSRSHQVPIGLLASSVSPQPECLLRKAREAVCWGAVLLMPSTVPDI